MEIRWHQLDKFLLLRAFYAYKLVMATKMQPGASTCSSPGWKLPLPKSGQPFRFSFQAASSLIGLELANYRLTWLILIFARNFLAKSIGFVMLPSSTRRLLLSTV